MTRHIPAVLVLLSVIGGVAMAAVDIVSPAMILTDSDGVPIEGVTGSTSPEKAMSKASRLPPGTYKLIRPDSTITVTPGAIKEEPEPSPDPVEPPPVVPDTSFLERCAQPGVVFCDPLSTHGPYMVNDGVLTVAMNEDGTEGVPTKTNWNLWRRVWENGTKALAKYDPGKDALLLTKMPEAQSSGLMDTNFSPDNSVVFGPGDAFSVEFEFWYDCQTVYMDCDPASATYKTDRRPFVHRDGGVQGAKIAIIAEGDVEGEDPAGACEWIQIVVNHNYGTVRGFHYCTKYLKFEETAGRAGGSIQFERNTGADYSCLRFPSLEPKLGESFLAGGTGPNCAYVEPDQWMRLKVFVRVGDWGEENTRVQFFFAHEGEEYGEVIDSTVAVRDPAPYLGYGQIHFQMHSTNALPDVRRRAWYRHLIVREES